MSVKTRMAPGLNEPVALGVGILVVGRNASVAQGVAHAGHRLNIVRFQDGLRVHTLSAAQGVRDRLFIRLLILSSLRTGTNVF